MKIEHKEFNILSNPTVPTTAIAIIIKDSKVLLTKRQNVNKENGKWALPGGYIDIGETALGAVVREVKEETGLDLRNPVFLDYCDEYFPKMKCHCIALVFKGEAEGNDNKREEDSEMQWFTIEQIKIMDLAFK